MKGYIVDISKNCSIEFKFLYALWNESDDEINEDIEREGLTLNNKNDGEDSEYQPTQDEIDYEERMEKKENVKYSITEDSEDDEYDDGEYFEKIDSKKTPIICRIIITHNGNKNVIEYYYEAYYNHSSLIEKFVNDSKNDKKIKLDIIDGCVRIKILNNYITVKFFKLSERLSYILPL